MKIIILTEHLLCAKPIYLILTEVGAIMTSNILMTYGSLEEASNLPNEAQLGSGRTTKIWTHVSIVPQIPIFNPYVFLLLKSSKGKGKAKGGRVGKWSKDFVLSPS